MSVMTGEEALAELAQRHRELYDGPSIDTALEAIIREFMPEKNKKEFEESWDTDFAYEILGVGRFRVNIFNDRHGVGAVLRQIPEVVPTPAQVGLPEALLKQ